MNDIRAKVAYLQGLAEGLDIDSSSAEGRVLSAMIDVLGDIAENMIDVADAHEELAAYVEDVDYDLGALEESVFGADDDDDDDDGTTIRFLPEESLVQEEDGVELLLCPQCGEALGASSGEVDGELDVVCPTCGCMICDADVEYDEDVALDGDYQ